LTKLFEKTKGGRFLGDTVGHCIDDWRVYGIWNSLPEDVLSAAHLSLFISRLVRVNLNHFLIGKM